MDEVIDRVCQAPLWKLVCLVCLFGAASAYWANRIFLFHCRARLCKWIELESIRILKLTMPLRGYRCRHVRRLYEHRLEKSRVVDKLLRTREVAMYVRHWKNDSCSGWVTYGAVLLLTYLVVDFVPMGLLRLREKFPRRGASPHPLPALDPLHHYSVHMPGVLVPGWIPAVLRPACEWGAALSRGFPCCGAVGHPKRVNGGPGVQLGIEPWILLLTDPLLDDILDHELCHASQAKALGMNSSERKVFKRLFAFELPAHLYGSPRIALLFFLTVGPILLLLLGWGVRFYRNGGQF